MIDTSSAIARIELRSSTTSRLRIRIAVEASHNHNDWNRCLSVCRRLPESYRLVLVRSGCRFRNRPFPHGVSNVVCASNARPLKRCVCVHEYERGGVGSVGLTVIISIDCVCGCTRASILHFNHVGEFCDGVCMLALVSPSLCDITECRKLVKWIIC